MNNQGGNFILFTIIPAIITAGLIIATAGLSPVYAGPDGPTVVINEIAWMGTDVSANDEWIELRNLSGVDIDLTGWTLFAEDGQPEMNLSGTLAASGYYLLERTDDDTVPDIEANLVYTGALGNSGEMLSLKDGEGNLIDVIEASESWPGGDNTTKATLERADSGEWQTSTVPGGTPNAANSAGNTTSDPQPPEVQPDTVCGNGLLEAGEGCDDGNTINNDGCSALCQSESSPPDNDEDGQTPVSTGSESVKHYRLGAVVINEFVSDPGDGDSEWVEIYNTLNETVEITGWTIEEGSGAQTKLNGSLGASGDSKYLVITKPKGNLNNAGDMIVLRDGEGVMLDQVAYGSWDDGNSANNAPAAGDPDSVARKIDGRNSFNNSEDFALTTEPTPGESNIIKDKEEDREDSGGENINYDYSDAIIITEFLPNPAGDDIQGEFIELYNSGDRTVDLAGWRLGDSSSRKYEIKPSDGITAPDATIIGPKSYLAIYRTTSGVALNNNGDSVKLFQPLNDTPLCEINYKNSEEGLSYNIIMKEAKQQAGSLASLPWTWSEITTPGQENVIETVNHSPEINCLFPDKAETGIPVIFDASDTLDPDGDAITFFWEFGDGASSSLACAEHTYFRSGTYSVKLAVSDGRKKTSKENIITVAATEDTDPAIAAAANNDNSGNDGLIINEFLPNPAGSDTENEFIELKNISDQEINLAGWQVDDSEGGSRPYVFKNDLWIEAGEYYVLIRDASGLALNNSSDQVRLFNPIQALIDSVAYEKPGEGLAYARADDGQWRWTDAVTPGAANVITETAPGPSPKTDTSASGDKRITGETSIPVSLAAIRDCDLGDRIAATGTVAVLPGVLGTQSFYIVGNGGIQVYSYKKDFPALAVGDIIAVTGEISETGGERRIKTATSGDIAVLSHGDAPIPLSLTSDRLTDGFLGQLISLNGEIVDRKGANLYLDDGTGEALVYLKSTTGITAADYSEGETAAISGILSRTAGGLRLLPRVRDDIVIKDAESDGAAAAPQVLGAFEDNDVWSIPAYDPKLKIFQYLLVMAAVAVAVLSGLLYKVSRQ